MLDRLRLETWLAGIASRQASHCRDEAYRRHELPAVDPDRLSAFAAPSREARIVARGLLRAFHRLRPELREVLALAATGLSLHEIAASLSLPRPTDATRLRLARRLFARALTRFRRWPDEAAPPSTPPPRRRPRCRRRPRPPSSKWCSASPASGRASSARPPCRRSVASLPRPSPSAPRSRCSTRPGSPAAFELGRRYHTVRARRGALLTDAARVARYFGPRLASLVHEELWIAALDSHGRVRETRPLARGGADVLTIDAATVLRTALDMAAVSFVFAHNYPSGDPTPTREDEAMTLELRHLSAEVHVPPTAHVVVTPSGRYAAVHE